MGKLTRLNRRCAHLHTPKHLTNPDHLNRPDLPRVNACVRVWNRVVPLRTVTRSPMAYLYSVTLSSPIARAPRRSSPSIRRV